MLGNKRHLILTTSDAATEEQWIRLLTDRNLFAVKIARSGHQTLQMIREEIPIGLIIDHSIVDLDVRYIIDKIRNNPVTRSVPVVIASKNCTIKTVEESIRSGVAHYICMPIDEEVFVDKIKLAVTPEKSRTRQAYFRVNQQSEVQAYLFGRISYISATGIHFETHLDLEPGSKIKIESSLSEALHLKEIEVEVKNISSDVYYNYPFAVDADWTDPQLSSRLTNWIKTHQHLNSPKKQKILVISPDLSLEASLVGSVDQRYYSLRFSPSIEDALEHITFLRPAGVVMDDQTWNQSLDSAKAQFIKYLKESGLARIFLGEFDLNETDIGSPLFIDRDHNLVRPAIESVLPPRKLDADRLYFSKNLPDSRCRFQVHAMLLMLGELGMRLGLEHKLKPPCNIQISLPFFADQRLKHPFVRAWPPTDPLSVSESSKGKFKIGVETQFLGLSEKQNEAIRFWLHNEELKEKREEIKDIPPAPKEKKNSNQPPK